MSQAMLRFFNILIQNQTVIWVHQPESLVSEDAVFPPAEQKYIIIHLT